METVRYSDCFWKGGQMFRLAIGECLAQVSHSIADAFTVHSFSHPMDMVWATWHGFVEVWAGMGLPDVFRSIDQCMRMSDAALRYGCDIDNSIVFNPKLPSPLFLLFDYNRRIPPQDLETAFRYLYNIGYDIEEKNSYGETLLLFAATQLRPSVVSILRLVMEKGADLHTVGLDNRGALHLAFAAPRRWGAWDSSCTSACDHADVDHVQWAQEILETESKNYAGDYCDHGLTPAPSVVDDIQNNKLTYDDEVQERFYWGSGRVCLPTTGSIGPVYHIKRRRSEQYIDRDEADDVDGVYLEVMETDDEGEDIEKNDPGDDGDADDDDDGENEDYEDDGEDEDYEYHDEDNNNGTEALRIPQGYVLYYDDRGDAVIVREPLPILKTRLRFKLLTLLRAGCDPNLLDKYGNSPSDEARYHGLWPEWTWALLNAGYVLDKDSVRWEKRVEDDVTSVS